MKLEGELALLHSNIGLESESKSFMFSENDENSTGYKLQNQKMKEYEDKVSSYLKNNIRGLHSSQYEMESADCMATPKLDFSNSKIDVKNEYEAQVRNLVGPVSHSFPIDKKSVTRTPTSPVSDAREERGLFENSVDVYMDKTVTECEPDVEVCYKESIYHVVKDICVDEGVLTKGKVMFVNTDEKEKEHNFFLSESCENDEKQKNKTGFNGLKVLPTKESEKVSANDDQPVDLMHKEDDGTGKLSCNVNKETPLHEDKVLLQDLLAQDSVPSDDKGEQISSEPEFHSESGDSGNIVEEAVLASPTSPKAEEESCNNSMLVDDGSITHQNDPSAPADSGKKECQHVGDCNCDEIQSISKLPEGKSDDQALTSLIHYSLGESSFSSVGPVSGRISYSGPVPYSGSISLRSDSSTTSTRSFAFPVLQSEWNSSPVRMAKADRRHYRKHRCWGHGLLCCKF